VYANGFQAIKNNSFSVDEGEIFGLLGPNGAGKSTTFNIVTAALSKTFGEVKILNCPINNGIMDIFSQFGVCPQYDSLYENMSVEEHIYYIARLKGIKEDKIGELAHYYY
jgi:ATP-binding cassette subfamily A (ABC1) protein 3